MDQGTEENAVIRKRTLGVIVVVALAAVVMGAPTLQGTFVGGDDHRLVLDHVLVNHPSIAHAIELFNIVHRDLYQPLPLLSFQAEFAVAGLLGLFDASLEGGAWLFHLTNVLLHAINAVLVWVVVRSVHRREHARLAGPIAIVAAVLFAIHPLEVEVVAWVNGRMMLLSTLFALASLASLAKWLDDRRYGWALLTLLLATCCAISKIRVSLPLLMLVVLLAQRRKPTVQFMVLWISCTAVTAVFTWVNYLATAEAGMFSGASHNLQGPKIVRALLALAWYFQHFVWPSGLASWYATPAVVSWSDGTTIRALAIVVPVLIVAGWSARRSRAAALGFAWFFVAMASTIQLVPTRNALAADRYMYLPIIGLLWFTASFLCGAYERLAARGPARQTRIAAGTLGAVVVVAMIAQSWHVASFYNSSLDKSRRIAELHPDVPHVWERVAWACYHAEDYTQAIALAEREFVHDDRNVRSDAHAVIGMSQFKMGQEDVAFESLRQAIEIDPRNSQVKYHFARALAEAGHIEEALRLYEESIEAAPLANPRIVRLAALYRQVGRPEDARPLYEQALRNNPYDVLATMGLTELDLETGTNEAYRDAARRLGTMLEWMPENADAWVNLGVVRKALGRTGPAIRAYREALAHDPQHLTAALNLAMLYEGLGDSGRAAPLFKRAAVLGVGSVEEMVAVQDFFLAHDQVDQAAALWDEFLTRFPDSAEARVYAGWTHAVSGRFEHAAAEADAILSATPLHPLGLATAALSSLGLDRYVLSGKYVDRLCATGDRGSDARQRLLSGLEVFGRQRPEVPWTFCLAAELLIVDGQIDGSRVGVDLCKQLCYEPLCQERVASLESRLQKLLPMTGAEAPP